MVQIQVEWGTYTCLYPNARDERAPNLKIRRIEFFDQPKTISGKIRRVELRCREEDVHRSATPIQTE